MAAQSVRHITKKAKEVDGSVFICHLCAPFMFSSPSLPPALASALERRGYLTLTPVQEAVLDPALAGRDLRISSRTGSGKTVALGLVLGQLLADRNDPPRLLAPPRALLVAPTRELAAQIGAELSWLYADLSARVCVVTGGTSVGKELRALSAGPSVIVGTPGRLCDHLSRGALDLSAAEMVVLDEADQMFDLGFREALETLLGALPESCRKHLVSATFPRAVHALAARYQKDPAVVAGSDPRAAHEDIDHVGHIVAGHERYAALVNVLLMAPDERALIFVRTRIGASELSTRLARDGFRAACLSGELSQEERTRTLEAFRAGALSVLVCTDVAARGIDVPDVTRVIHGDLPDNGEVLTHRSGRTGRAGNKGQSIMLVTERERDFAEMLLRRANIRARLAPPPSPSDIQQAAQERLVAALGAHQPNGQHGALAAKLIETLGAEAAVEALLARSGYEGFCLAQALSAPRPSKPRFVSRAESMRNDLCQGRF
jgi:ATP-dependent RNA helicase DeaD